MTTTLPAFAGRVYFIHAWWHIFFIVYGMANKSSKAATGEDREAPSEYLRDQEVEKKDIRQNTGSGIQHNAGRPGQENQKNRGYEEDQPHQPVRTNGSTSKEQETLPTGEPDPGE